MKFGQVVNSFSFVRPTYFGFVEFKLRIKHAIVKVFVKNTELTSENVNNFLYSN